MNAQLSVVPPTAASAATSASPAPVRGFVLHVDLGPEAFAASIDDVMVTADTLRELVHEWLPQARTRTAVTATVPGEAPAGPAPAGPAPAGRRDRGESRRGEGSGRELSGGAGRRAAGAASPSTGATPASRAEREPRAEAPAQRGHAAWPAGEPAPTERSAASLRARLAALPDVPAIVVDLRTHEVTVGGRVLRLTTKEFDLLAYLVRAQGRVVGRTELHETVWRDRAVGAESRTVDVHIRRLRAVPELAGLVATVHGSGYRVSPRPYLTVAE